MFLGVDIGTSAVKAVVADEAGRVAAQSASPLSVSRPRPLWSEQDPEDWWRATDAAVMALDPALRAQVRGVGLAGQMHGATLLDGEDRVLRPAILWNDGRAAAECAALEAAEPRTRAITGNPAMAGFTAPKLLWLRAHEPDVFARVRTVLLPKDYVRLRMSGDKATDMSDASGTLWLEVGARRWSAPMLAASGLDERAMPRLCEGPDPTGVVRADIAERWGMKRAPIAAGAGDNAAAAIGLGVIDADDAFLSLGTSGVLFVATDRFRPNPNAAVHAFAHALPERWHQMSVMLSAAACLDWAAALLGFDDVAALLQAAQSAPESGGVIFLPYLSGERTPHADPFAKGVLFGMSASSDRAAIARAVLEGVAMALRDGLDVLTEAGSNIGAIRMAGGGSRSKFWTRLIAAALGRPLLSSDNADVGPAFGAARLARLAVQQEDFKTVCAAQPVSAVQEPDADLRDAFAARQPRFRQLYADLRASFRSVT